jgi:zinc D-Ala-D-Ala carboxypeptidase
MAERSPPMRRGTQTPTDRTPVDGIAAITSRIAEIRGTLASVGGTPLVSSTSATRSVASAGTFASALATEVANQTTSVGGSRGVLNAQGNPADLAMYSNGKIPKEALSAIGSTGHRMWAPAARQFEQLSAAAAADGVTIRITDSYRTYESQVDLAERKGLYSQGGLAAKPGTSDHGWGRSLDLDLNGPALAWMRENGARYGFKEDVPRESWHWTYYPPGS